VNVSSLRNYLASKHNFASANLSAQDAQDLVVLTVGNAYLLAVADETQVSSVEAQVATAKVSLDQAVANHSAGTAPRLDELRARVDYQTLQQQLIVAQNALEKDKLALARTIGLPLAQKFTLADRMHTPTGKTWLHWWSRPRLPSSSAKRRRLSGIPPSSSTGTTVTLA
jgi:outer membrane protein TolC